MTRFFANIEFLAKNLLNLGLKMTCFLQLQNSKTTIHSNHIRICKSECTKRCRKNKNHFKHHPKRQKTDFQNDICPKPNENIIQNLKN